MKDKFKDFCKRNKVLLTVILILNITFLTIVILSLCGVNIAKLSVENEFLTKMNNWLYKTNLAPIIAGLIFTSNVYFCVSISSNDYTVKPLIYCICLCPIFIFFQYGAGVNPLWISFLTPFCVSIAYSFKFSTMWKSALFIGIVTGYQYLMQMAKLSLFGFQYLNASLLNYIVLSIDLYIVYIIYFIVCKTIYRNKINKEVE